jgi:hypothetical protein
MANTSVYRLSSQTQAISVTTASSTAVSVTPFTNDQINYASFLNVGSAACAINYTVQGTAGAAVFPSGATQGGFVLPPVMETPIVLAIPPASSATPLSVTAIASSGTTSLYVTLVNDQS